MAIDMSKLSDAELQAISSGNMAALSDATLKMLAGEEAPAPAGAPPSLGGLALRSAITGLSSPINMVADFYSGALNLGLGLLGETARAPYLSKMQKDALTQIGLPAPATTGQKLFSAGAEAIASPLNYVFPGSSAIKSLVPAAQIPVRAAEQAIVGTGAEAGGMVGEYGGEKLGFPTTGRIVGGLFGGAGSAYGTGTALRVAPLAGKGFDVAKSQWDKLRGATPEDELLKDVDNRISNIFVAAAAADPTFMKTISDAAKAQNEVFLRAPGSAAVRMPISALLSDNPVINNFIQNLSAKDPVFRAQYGAQYEAAKQALTQNQIRLFGDPSKVSVKAVGPDLTKVQAQRIKSLDEQIADASIDQSIDPNVFGQRITNLVNKKEKAAYAEVKPLYTEAFDIAQSKNVTLPPASVDDIYNFVASEQASDIFKTFPSIYNRVRANFRPTTVEPSAILTAEGKPMTPGGVQFKEATIQDLDSLKREINRQLGKTDVPTEIRLLSELKQRVGGHIDSLDPEFVNAYRNADKAYLQKIGLPFDAATMQAVDRKKFVEQVVPAIIGNKSNVSEFVNATGPEGLKLVRSVFLDSFTNATMKDGVMNPKAAEKWLKKNEGGTSLVPGLNDELRSATTDVQKLLDAKASLNAEFQKVKGAQIIGAEGVKSPQELVSKMYGDLKFTNKFMQQYGADKDSVNAVRSFMLDDLVTSQDPLGLLADRNKSAIFNRVFGPTYSQKVQDFVTVSDRLNRDLTNVTFKGETVPKTPIEQLTGIPPEQILSRIYNPVSGVTYAITSLFSKFWAKKASQATETKLKDLLLNPNDAVKVFQTVQPRVDKMNYKKFEEAINIGKKYGIDWVKDAANDITTGAARGTIQEAQQ